MVVINGRREEASPRSPLMSMVLPAAVVGATAALVVFVGFLNEAVLVAT